MYTFWAVTWDDWANFWIEWTNNLGDMTLRNLSGVTPVQLYTWAWCQHISTCAGKFSAKYFGKNKMNTLPTGFELTTSTLTRQLVPLLFQLSYTAFPDNRNEISSTTYCHGYHKFSFSTMPSYIKKYPTQSIRPRVFSAPTCFTTTAISALCYHFSLNDIFIFKT